jgi:hypothetical protein
MKTPHLIPLTLFLLCLGAGARGATHYVTPGESIQAKVNLATAGDTIVIFGGTYAESVTLDKQVTLQRLAGESVFITGDLTVQGVVAGAATPMIVSNLKIGGDGSKQLSINSSANIVVNNVDLTAGAGFAVTASTNVVLGNSAIQRAEMSASSVTLSRVTAYSFVRMNNTTRTNLELNVLQCSVTNDFVEVNGGKGRILYSDLRFVRCTSADSIIIGNRIASPQGGLGDGLVRLADGKALLRNNEIGPVPGVGCCLLNNGSGNNGVSIANCETLIANNYIHDLGGGYGEGEDDHQGVYIQTATKRVEVVGNIFWGTRRAVFGPFENVVYRYNNDVERVNHAGGVIGDNIISVDPLFVNKASGNYQLATNSPCINAGPTDSWFNDRNGSRNDMGLFGGAAYDPDGKTTDKPITFLLQAAPLTVIKGVHTNLTISGGGIVIGK